MSEPETKPAPEGGGELKAAAASSHAVTEEVKAPSNPEVTKEEPTRSKKNKWESIKKFMYNKEAGEVLGRTGMSWLKIFIFYVVFYIALFAFFFLMLFIALLTMPADKPKYLGTDSLIGNEPGLSFVPAFKKDEENKNTFDYTGKKIPKSVSEMGDQLDEYLKSLKKIEAKDCGFKPDGNNFKSTDITQPDKYKGTEGTGGACKVQTPENSPDLNWGDCEKKPYGWVGGQEFKTKGVNSGAFKPCVLVKVNRLWGWKPPKRSENKDKKARSGEDTAEAKTFTTNGINILCHPSSEKGSATVKVYPSTNPGKSTYIPGGYFPYMKQKNFTSPFVMVQLTDLKTAEKNLLEITCSVNHGYEVKFQFLLGKKDD